MQGCYLFCLLRPENALEEAVEQFVEEEMDVFDELPPPTALPEETETSL